MCVDFKDLFRNTVQTLMKSATSIRIQIYEGWNFNSGNYLFTTDTK